MAKQTGIFPFSGRLGNVVGNKNGHFRIHVDPSNPRTLKQQVVRTVQTFTSKLFAGLSPIARILLGASWMSELIQINRDEVVAKDANGDLADPDNYQIPVGTVQLVGGNPDLVNLDLDTDATVIDSGAGTINLDWNNNGNVLEGDYSHGGKTSSTTDTVVALLHNRTTGRVNILGTDTRALPGAVVHDYSVYCDSGDDMEVLVLAFDEDGGYTETEHITVTLD